jgi:hypothetical protein
VGRVGIEKRGLRAGGRRRMPPRGEGEGGREALSPATEGNRVGAKTALFRAPCSRDPRSIAGQWRARQLRMVRPHQALPLAGLHRRWAGRARANLPLLQQVAAPAEKKKQCLCARPRSGRRARSNRRTPILIGMEACALAVCVGARARGGSSAAGSTDGGGRGERMDSRLLSSSSPPPSARPSRPIPVARAGGKRRDRCARSSFTRTL